MKLTNIKVTRSALYNTGNYENTSFTVEMTGVVNCDSSQAAPEVEELSHLVDASLLNNLCVAAKQMDKKPDREAIAKKYGLRSAEVPKKQGVKPAVGSKKDDNPLEKK